VALAKNRVYGEVGIDMMAGPSEVLIVADDGADPEWAAADLLAQAEHDPMARAVLVTDSPDLASRVARALGVQLGRLARQAIAAEALRAHGALVLVRTLEEAVALANRLAPEHLELLVRVPQALPGRMYSWIEALIHHMAYVASRKPLSGSKRLTACIRPTLPSEITSEIGRP